MLLFRRRKINPYKETLYALYNVKQGISRIEILIDKIKARREKLFEMTAQLEMRGETFLAKRYASEIAKLDKIIERLTTLRLVLEKVSLGLEYALTLHNFNGVAREVLGVIDELKKLPEATIPDIGLTFANIEASLRNLENTDIEVPDISPPHIGMDTDAEKILQEAREIVRSKLEGELMTETSEM